MTKTNKKPKSKASKIFNTINTIITILLLIVLVVVAVNAIWSMIDSTYVFSIFGYQFYTVVTGSMVPKIPIGSLVISKSIKDDTKFKEGDIITFNVKNNVRGEKMIVTHYFREIVETPSGRFHYVTYPEANKDNDQTDGFFVELSDIRGKYVTHIPWIGKLAQFLKSPIALAMYAVIILILVGASYYLKRSNKNKPDSTETVDKSIT